MTVMPKLARNLSKEEVVSIASEQADQEIFEKDGCTWVGWIGLKFSEEVYFAFMVIRRKRSVLSKLLTSSCTG